MNSTKSSLLKLGFGLGLIALVLMQCDISISTDVNTSAATTAEQISLSTASGSSISALIAGPNDAKIGIVLVHDWFGVTDFTREAVARFGANGYRAIAVDLYSGQSAETHKGAFALMKTVNADSARAIIKAGTEFLSSPDRMLAVIGYSMGAEYAIDAAIEFSDDISASVVWYGGTSADSARLSGLHVPILVIGGGKDSPETTYELARLLESMDRSIELHIFPGLGHAFAQPLFNGGNNFDLAATESSWLLTEDFLRRHLQPLESGD